MTTEAALLGTQAIYVSSLVGTMGNFEDLARYGLVEAYQEGVIGVERAIVLIKDQEAKSERQRLCQDMLSDMIDVTAFLISTVESHGLGEMKA